jgi:hypothetical protein
MVIDNSNITSVVSSVVGIQFDPNAVTVESLSSDRIETYSPFLDGGEKKVFSVTGIDTQDNQLKYVIVTVSEDGSSVEVPTVSCQITFEDLTLSQCLEYRFADEPQWRIAQLSSDALEDFKLKKFKLWEHQLDEPECEAAFRRLLQQGPIRNVFDKFIFPSSDEVAAKYKVIDEHSGKSVDVPHQVSEMRIWNPSLRGYEAVDCSLVGAPSSDREAEEYWARKISQLKELRGSDYIESLLGGKH